jgi:hypothetical protein
MSIRAIIQAWARWRRSSTITSASAQLRDVIVRIRENTVDAAVRIPGS